MPLPHHLFYWILRSLFMHDMIESDHRKDRFSSSEPAYPLYRAYTVVGTKTHLIVNSNVASKVIYLHGPINSSSHTLP